MKKKNRPPVPQGSGPNHKPNHTPPVVSGQRARVLNLIRERPKLSLELTADYAIPEAAARKHELLAMGFNIITEIKPKVIFRGEARYNVALYSLGNPEWLWASSSTITGDPHPTNWQSPSMMQPVDATV